MALHSEVEHRFSREQQALEALNVDGLRKELETLGVRWYFVDGAIDFVRNGKKQILSSYEDYKDDPKILEQILSQLAESHILNFTPTSWTEPIRVPVGMVDDRLTTFLGKRLAEVLRPIEK